MKTTTDYKQEVGELMQDGASIIPSTDYDGLIDRALEQYSRARPRTVVTDRPGASVIPVLDLAGFDKEFSGDPEIEYPISTEGEPNLLDRRDWLFYYSASGATIRLRATPASGEQVRFTYKAQHQVTESTSTVPESDFFAVCKLAAAEGCEQLARHYTQVSGGQIADVDLSNAPSKAKEYEDRATRLRKQYKEHVGGGSGESGPSAASVVKNWDTSNSRGGDRLTHPRRYR